MAPGKKHMLSPPDTTVVDKRRAISAAGDGSTHSLARSTAPFTCNATGTTTTAIGANAAPATNDNNVARRGEKFQIFTAAGVKKEETIFTVTGVAVAGSTTLTYSPASAVASVSTDVLRWISYNDYEDGDNMLARLTALGYTDPQINGMSWNDMQYAIRQSDNLDSL